MPKDLPPFCPHCGAPFHLQQNVQVVPGKLRRASEVAAKATLWAGVVFLILIMIFHAFPIGESLPRFRSLGFGMMALLAGPHLICEMLTSILPRVRLLTGHRCRFSGTYPFPTG